ncbi:MAG: 2-dehydropantoate 2-reductase [Ignavibacteriales bacterium]|nr:2-dehydropantoate 2-reductase [Ignavibacteriales bacterium]
MRVLILGTGGVGGYFGAKLAAGGNDVWFVARGSHLAAMQERGLVVQSPEKTLRIPPGQMVARPADAPPADVIFFCVKSYDTESAAEQLKPAIHSRSVILCLQNGIDNEEKIQRILPDTEVYGGVAYISSTMTAPGEITEGGGIRKIVFGPTKQSTGTHTDSILHALTSSGIQAERSSDIRLDLWKKFVFITGAAGVTALTRQTLHEIISDVYVRQLFRDAMAETELVGRAHGVPLPSDIVEGFLSSVQRFKNNTYSSLYHDLVNGKPLEIDALAGTVVRLADRYHLAVPIQQTIYAALHPFHVKHQHLRQVSSVQ